MSDDHDLGALAARVDRLETARRVPAAPDRYVRPGDRRERDLIGRLTPQRLDFVMFVKHIPGLAERVRKVPARAVVDETTNAAEPTAYVECPCGARPVAEVQLSECPGECGRWYIYRESVFVVYGELDPPPLPV